MTGNYSDDTERDQPLEEVIGKKIVDVEYSGDYYTPFTLVLEDGTLVDANGVGERTQDTGMERDDTSENEVETDNGR